MTRIKKMILSVVCAVVVFSGATVSAATANLPAGLLIGDNDGIHVSGDGNYFIYADNMRAGDVINKTLSIYNTENDKPFSLSMTAKPLFSEGRIDLLDRISLELKLNGNVIYSGRVRGTDGVNMVDNALQLGKFAYNDRATMEIHLKLDEDIPIGYFYDKNVAEVAWNFLAIKDEAAPPPKTGVLETVVYISLGIMALSACLLLFLARRNKRVSDSSVHS